MPRPPNLELDQLSTSSSSAPNSPDLPLSTEPQPRWLSPRQSRFAWLTPYLERAKALLRPRLTWRYVLCALCGVYVLYCCVVGSPLFASRLPAYSGPYGVGAVDLEVPLSKPVKISDTIVKKTGEPAFEVETALFTVYYPAVKGAKSKKPKHLWVPRPLSITAEGYARIAHVDNFIIRPIFTFALWLLVGSIEIPAKVDVPIFGSDNLGEKAEKFPVMVFSHGMASSRTDYTGYLGELASRGHVVAAIEHRDGSSPGSLVKIKGKKDRKVVLLRESDLKSDPPMTTPKIKQEQLAFRDAEIFETIRILQSINDGKGEAIFSQTSRSEGSTLSEWANRLDFKHLTIGGHSYGATGALQALKLSTHPDKPTPVGGIILDPGKESGPLNADIPVPILVVHSNSWSKTHSIFFGRPHFDTVRDLVLDALNRTGASWFLTSLGTSHPSVTDAPLIEPLLLSWTTGATIDVKDGLREYVRVSMDFLDFLMDREMKGVLDEPVTHEEYGKWVSEERKEEFPKEMAKFWEVHVSPVKKKA